MRRHSKLSALLGFAMLPILLGMDCAGLPGLPGGGGFPRTTPWTAHTISGAVSERRPWVVAVADFDGDGRLDVVVGFRGQTDADSAVTIFFQEAPENFTAVTISTGAELAGIAALAIADLDGDMRLDIVAACNGRLNYLHSPADPRNAAGWTRSAIDQSSGDMLAQWNDVAIGNIDGANGPDIVACNAGPPGRVIWFRSPAANIATGTGWTRIDIDATTRTGAASIALADFSGDDRLDVISTASTEDSERIAWYRNPMNPQTDMWTKFPIGNLSVASRLAVADLNNDERTDVIAMNATGRRIGWYARPEDATAAWTNAGHVLAEYTTATPVDVKAGDLTGNGRPNVVVATNTGATLRWFRPFPGQQPTARWEENNVANVMDATLGRIALGDINGDDRPDVIVPIRGTNAANDRVIWYENPEP